MNILCKAILIQPAEMSAAFLSHLWIMFFFKYLVTEVASENKT